jgi:TFIIF-interacting CTD phosphatase-like protein
MMIPSNHIAQKQTKRVPNIITQTIRGKEPSQAEQNKLRSPASIYLPPQSAKYKGRKTLVLNLDETLVHSTFQQSEGTEIVLPVFDLPGLR